MSDSLRIAREALTSALEAMVLGIAFLNRDHETNRAERTVPQVVEGLAKADAQVRRALVALEAGEGWRPIAEAPSSGQVLATRLAPGDRKWAYGLVQSPPTYPFTHWRPLPDPPTPPKEGA